MDDLRENQFNGQFENKDTLRKRALIKPSKGPESSVKKLPEKFLRQTGLIFSFFKKSLFKFYMKGIKPQLFLLCASRPVLFRRCHIGNTPDQPFDVIVVGGGHAGVEACCAASRMGAKTLLVTHKKETIGEMSCNPSFGGVGKGHLMREVDALDGVCGRICDLSGIHYKVLNRSKGPAVWGLRAQIDRKLYKQEIQKELFTNTPNLKIIYTSVDDLIVDSYNNECKGLTTKDGDKIYGKTVVLTTGTFLNGQINIGLKVQPAGRIGDKPSISLANTLKNLNFRMGRMKTGTPPRLRKDTINFNVCDKLKPDDPSHPFSFMNDNVWIRPEDQLLTYLVYTNENVGKIIFNNMHLNNHVKEEITGPRHCPSIESKYIKFKKSVFQVWLEPEGLDSDIIYPGGLSCTLPEELQVDLVHQIKGLENAEVVRPGYGVEYDYVDPRELNPTLETIKIPNLFFAGQINGTTGYEEAAAQGIIAGINAAAKCQNKSEFTISRSEGYIGVLIDDLTCKGTNEPYRMFTSRSEFRVYLRPDNADLRLTEKGYKIGCVSEERFRKTIQVKDTLNEIIANLKSVRKSLKDWQARLNTCFSPHNTNIKSAFEMMSLLRSQKTPKDLRAIDPETYSCLPENRLLVERIIIESLYKSALESELAEIEEARKDEALRIPSNIDYHCRNLNLSLEEKEKLEMTRPQTIAAASRIPGITPSAIIRLLKFAQKQSKNTASN